MKRLFTEHPASVGETYLEHMGSAWSFSAHMLVGAIACLLHGILPFLFTKTGSEIITGLYDRMVVNRSKLPPVATRNSRDAHVGAAADAHTVGS